MQFWEDMIEPIQFAHTVVGVYDWLKTRMKERSGSQNSLPDGMPGMFEEMSVVTLSGTALPTV
jgi:hypothetical protein